METVAKSIYHAIAQITDHLDSPQHSHQLGNSFAVTPRLYQETLLSIDPFTC